MTYIIATADKSRGDELIKILQDDEAMAFTGSFAAHKAAEASIREKPPDMAFIWLGETEINAYRLANVIKEQNALSKVIFVSSHRENAVEAFENEADGFLLIPFDKRAVGKLIQSLETAKKDTGKL